MAVGSFQWKGTHALVACRRLGPDAWLLLCAGAAMAVGVSCAGTGMRSALDLLAPLLTDAVDFVRQGALIANALVLMQQPESKVCCLHYYPTHTAQQLLRGPHETQCGSSQHCIS